MEARTTFLKIFEILQKCVWLRETEHIISDSTEHESGINFWNMFWISMYICGNYISPLPPGKSLFWLLKKYSSFPFQMSFRNWIILETMQKTYCIFFFSNVSIIELFGKIQNGRMCNDERIRNVISNAKVVKWIKSCS